MLASLEDGYGAMPKIVIQPPQGAIDNSLRLFPRSAFGQDYLSDAPHKQRTPKRSLGLMKQQIAMMLAVGRQHFIEH